MPHPLIELYQNAINAFKEQNLELAEKYLREVLALDADNGVAHSVIGLIASAQHRNAEALTHLKNAAALCPDEPITLYNYASILQRTARYDEAVLFYERALALKPDYIGALNNYSALMNTMGLQTKAEEAARAIIAINPRHIDPHVNLGNSLKDQGRIDEAIASYQAALAINPGNAIARSNLLLCRNYRHHDAQDMLEAHTAWEHHQEHSRLNLPAAPMPKNPLKSFLRIGYVSAYFKMHAIANFLEPILQHHDRSRFEVYCYADVVNPDPVTLHLQNLPLTWRPILGQSDAQVAAMIVRDDIDILVDVAGHAGNVRMALFVNRLAPVQVTCIGYPNTTGLSTIDFRLTDAFADPPDQDRFYTETLYRLPGCFLCFAPLISLPAVAPPPAEKNGYVTFGSFNNLAKISPETIAVWSSVLKAVPDSRLFIKTKHFNDGNVLQRYISLFTANGIDERRLRFKGYADSFTAHLAEYGEMDIGLDTFPYNGTTTTCEALRMGVPVVTLAGDRHAGRVGVSLLSCIGLTGMIAHTKEAYVACASFLARDIPQLAKLRAGLRPAIARSPLCDESAYTAALENAYRDMWRKRCERGNAV